MDLHWLDGALADLDEIEAYIARDNPAAAQTVLDRIHKRVSELRDQPRIGRPGRITGTRELVVSRTPYVVAYSVEDQSVEIIAVIHGARKWPEAF
jgi:toxin ParE1/3/4